jgi:hypothetical protein
MPKKVVLPMDQFDASGPAAPLQVRGQLGTDERPTRRSMARETSSKAMTAEVSDAAVAPRKRHVSPSTAGEFHVTDGTAAVGSVPRTGAVRETHVAAPSPPGTPNLHAREPRQRKANAHQTACPEAVRRGLPVPPLPSGQRWKRRLPPACR